MSDSCVFCGIIAGEVEHVRVAETALAVAFMDANPASDGHLLVIPRRHSRDLLEISPEDLAATSALAQRLAGTLVDSLGADGVNLLNCCGADAWQTVFHFHFHVIPRYRDKTKERLSPPWTPGLPGDPHLLAALGERIRDQA